MPRTSSDSEVPESHRLAIALELAEAREAGVEFAALRRRVALSDGNLHCHLRRLIAAGWVEARANGARGRASRTEFRLTASGWGQLALWGRAYVAAARRIDLVLGPGEVANQPRAGETGLGGVLPRAALPGTTAAMAAVVAAAAQVAADSLVDERFSGPD